MASDNHDPVRNESANTEPARTEPAQLERRWPLAAGRLGRDVPISASRPRPMSHRSDRNDPQPGGESMRWPGNATIMSAYPKKRWACLAVQARQDPGR
jgi:hypothetical protein